MSIANRISGLRVKRFALGATVVSVVAALLAGSPSVPAQAGGSPKLAQATQPLVLAHRLTAVVSGLNQPDYVAVPPGDTKRLFIVEKTGTIQIFAFGHIFKKPFLDITSKVASDGERGLLSMAFDPSYGSNRYFYVYYTNLSGTITVARYQTLANNPNQSGTSARIFASIPHPSHSNHNGGQLQFDPVAAHAGRAILYFGTGDGGGAGDPNNNAQNLRSGLGKMWRIDVHASKPQRQLFAYGLRNPWRFSFDRVRGALRIGDVGQDSWEELDYLGSGAGTGTNFGWRKYEGRHLYHNQWINTKQLRWPFYEYPHSNGNCAVVGGYLYRGSVSSLYGYYIFGDLCTGNIWAEQSRHVTQLNISGQVSNLCSFGEGNSAELYVISLDGTVYKLTA